MTVSSVRLWSAVAASIVLASALGLLVTYDEAGPSRDVGIASLSNTTADHGYTGWSACIECHPRRVEEFKQTRHFKALRLADQAVLPNGFFSGHNQFTPPGSPVRFEMNASPKPEVSVVSLSQVETSKTVSPISFVYGSEAGTDEVYFVRRGEEIFELPIVWMHHQDKWGATLFDPYGSDDLSRPLAPQCLECHTVWVDHKRGTLNRYGAFEPEMLGVTCERCHGPAKVHVAHHKDTPTDKSPKGILNPKTLSRERQMDICAQCHTNAVRHRRAPFSYRPGEDLGNSFFVLEMEHPEQDRVANQVRYLKESRCYQQSESLTCTTCHDPHQKSHRGDTVKTTRSCFACHNRSSCGEQQRIPEPLRGKCTECHMPKRTKTQIAFDTEDGNIGFPAPRFEHRIGIYPEAGKELLVDWYKSQPNANTSEVYSQLESDLSEYWVNVAKDAESQQRFLVAINAYQTALKFHKSSVVHAQLKDVMTLRQKSKSLWFEGEYLKRERRLDEAIAVFQSLLKIEPNLSKAHLELGTLYAAIGRSNEAVEHLSIATERDSNDPSAHAMLGWLEHLKGNSGAALNHYRRAAAIEPWGAKIQQMVGVCLMNLGEYDAAAKAFLQSLRIDPKLDASVNYLRQILRVRIPAKEALALALEGVSVTDSCQSGLLLTLSEIYRELGEMPEARRAIAAAKRFSNPKDTSLLRQIQTVETSLSQSPPQR